MNPTAPANLTRATKFNAYRPYLKMSAGFLAVASMAILGSSPTKAASSTWTGSAGSSDWATAANWGGAVPTTGSALIFTSANASPTTTLTNSLTNGAFSVGGITFNAGASAYTMTGNTFNLSAGVTNNSGVLQTFSNTTGLTDSGSAITFTVGTGGISITTGLTNSNNGNQATTVNGTGTLTLSSFTINSGSAPATESFAGTGNIVISGAVGNGGAGTNGLANTGSGVLTLNGNDTYTGATTLGQSTATLPLYTTGPTINLGNAGALGGNGAFNLYYGTFDNSSTGSLALSSTNTVTLEANAFVTFGGSQNLSFGSNTFNWNGNSILNLNGTGSTLTMGSGINATGGGIVVAVNGAGNTFVLNSFTLSNTAASNFTLSGNGNITFSSGLLGGAFPTGAFTYNGLGTVTMGGTSSYTGGTILNHGTIAVIGTLPSSGGVTANGGILNESSTGVIQTALTLNGGTNSFIGGAVNLSGQNTFTSTTVNPYTTLTLDYSNAGGATSGLLASTGTVSMLGGTLVIKGGSGQTDTTNLAKFTVSGAVPAASAINFVQNGATALNSTITTVSRNAGATLDITLPTAGTVTFTGAANTNGVFTSAASGVAYTSANGGATWATSNVSGVIGALSTYSTGTANYLSTNNVDVTNGDSVGTKTVGTLRFNGSNIGLSLTGVLTDTTGGILVTPGSTGTISTGTLTAGSTGHEVVFLDYGSLSVGSVINGATVSVTAAGTGTTTLSGANTFAGGVVIDNGATVVASNATALGTGTATMGLDATLALRGDVNTSFGNTILDAGGTIDIDVNNITSGTTNKTLSVGNVIFSTQQQYNITGGNGYTLGMGNFTTAGTTNTGIVINPTSASVTIGNITGNGAAAGNTDTIRLDGTSTGNFVTGIISNPTLGPVTITKSGSSTWTLTGANTYTGLTTVSGGVLNIGNGTIGNLNNSGTFSALTMSGTGTINFNEAAGTAQSMGALTFSSGDGMVESTYGGSSTTSVTFASLAARGAGATEDYVINGGTNGSSNSIILTGAAAGFINQGAFFGAPGSGNYAWMNASGTYVRAINYSGDTNATTTSGGTSITPGTNLYFQTTGAVTAQATATMTTLNLAGTSTATGANDFTLASAATLSTNGILRSGNTANSSATISGGAGIAFNSSADMVIRTDGANDNLTINTVISGANANDNLVKSGAGTLTLGTLAVDTFYGNVYVDQGVLNISQDSNLGGYTGTISSLFLNGGTLQAGASNVSLVANRNVVLSTTQGGTQTIDTNGNTLTINGVVSGGLVAITSGGNISPSFLNKIGTGTLVLNGTDTYVSQTQITAGTLQLGNGGTSGAIEGSGAIIDNSNFAINRSNTTTQGYDFLGTISGTGSVTQMGSGTTILNAANTFGGGVTVNSGTVSVTSLSSVGTAQPLGAGGTVTLAGTSAGTAGVLQYTGGTGKLSQAVTVSTGDFGTILNTGGGVLTLAGTISKNGSVLNISGGKFVETGTITGASANSDLNVVNNATLGLTTTNSYVGPTSVSGNSTLLTGTNGAIPSNSALTLGASSDTGTNTLDLLGTSQTVTGLKVATGSGATNQVISSNGSASTPASGTGTSTSVGSLTVNYSGSSTDTFTGSLGGSGAATSFSLVKTGTGALALANATGNTYSGGTTVSGGTLLLSNTSNSATGTGALSVGANAVLAGTGRSSGSSFSIAGTGTTSTAQAYVLVGHTSAADTNTTATLTLLGSGASNISNADLVFNLNVNAAGQSNKLNVGSTAIAFGSGVTFTLNMDNTPGIVGAYTTYSLVTGTANSQYTGLTTFSNALGQLQITSLSLAFGDALSQQYYGNGSYLYLDNGNIDVEVVPEPSTWAMMAGGLAALLFWQRRKSRQS